MNKNPMKKITTFMIPLIALVLPVVAHGQLNIELNNPLQADSIADLVATILDFVLQLGAIAATLAIIYAGFMYVTAQGDTSKITTAHRTFLYAVIGAAIILGSKVILEVIRNTVNAF
jgi:hypothetical protein